MLSALLALALGTLTTPVDPLPIQDDDFARHRSPADWQGLTVERIEFKEERAAWRLWRIANRARPSGPLWFVPHDNEDAGFEAALAALRLYGGTLIAVDAGIAPGRDGNRLNHAVDHGEPVDPNRNFDSALPGYARRILAGLAPGAPIIALHTNSPGFDPTDSRCNRADPRGEGIISIRFCDDILTPAASKTRAWPFDDDDTVAFATFHARQQPSDAFCRNPMVAADFNVVQERVVTSDGSLSNYAVLHGLRYLNFETQDRGAAGLAEARDRLLHMIDFAMRTCVRSSPRD
ncbi:hypothetical protein LQ953_07325 [Sphingomonas sp. IC-56]|uniref:hypothetical protein n=1 Tax=Sphingomonas sp. IC-56 TaxID=2898529 RepID=UPI001E293C5C|nr:hypothetical protein [Sphingomonas sp. IC-56]MCD2323825.1 hypothetical protein [Sphingomonas sp. IC-56]